MFDQIYNFSQNTNYNFVHFNQIIENYGLIGEIDMIDDQDNLWEIKVAQDINLKYILQLLMYNVMKSKNTYDLHFLNFLSHL